MLVEAASKRWNVPATTLKTENGMVIHAESGRKLSCGELALEASALPVPTDVVLKDKKDFKLIGQPVRNVENKNILTGSRSSVSTFTAKACCTP